MAIRVAPCPVRVRGAGTLIVFIAVVAVASPARAAAPDPPTPMHAVACKDCHCPPSLSSRLPHAPGAAAADPAPGSPDALPPWSSAVCLGCHEGVRSEPTHATASGEHPPSRVCVQHRVGIVYGEWVGAPAMVRRTPPADLPLFGPDQRVECATCHAVHGSPAPHLLRASIAGSVLCGKCH